jgi:hypothetical protein
MARGTYLDEAKPSEPSADSLDPERQRALVDDTAQRLAISLP